MARPRDLLGVRRNYRTGGMYEPSCHPTDGTSGRRSGSHVTETRCAISSLSSMPPGKFGCGRLWWHLSQAWHGPALLDKLPGRGVGRLTLSKIPEGGVHIDLPRKAVGAWQTADTMGIFQATRGQSGRAYCQTRGSAGTPRTRSRGERRCRRRLLRPSPRGGVGPLRRRVQFASGRPCGISLSSARTGAHHCIMMW